MPALVAFNRRWQIGSDDLVFVFGGGLLARLFWLIVLCIIFGIYHKDIKSCHGSSMLEAFFIGVIVVIVVVMMNECLIIWMSMQGTIINTRPRQYIPYLLYIQLLLYVPELCLSGLGTYWAFHESKGCEKALTIPVQITVVFQWCVLLSAMIVVVVFFDPLGSSQAGDQEVQLHKTTKLWERRCKVLCCCFAGGDEDYMVAISDIAKVFASELHGLDAVPSDVAVGLILLQQQQDEEEKRLLEQGKAPVEGEAVDLSDPAQKVLIKDAAYFMKYSLGSYGWPLYVFMNPCCGALRFCGKIRCCSCCIADNPILGDNCCMCNTAAVHLQSQMLDDDLFYISFHNKLYEIPFYVAIDDNKHAVVISVRGTLSMRDTLTDMTGHGERIDIHVEGLEDGSMAHKGMFLSAMYIKDQLIDKHILQGAFEEAQRRDRGDYRLIIVGHSLGAGTASVLSVLLKPLYPNLQCFAYSNPSCLNDIATAHAKDYVMSIILGRDVVPRLGIKNLNTLVQDLETVIMNCNLPKYRVLMSGFWRALCFCLGKRTNTKGERQPLNSVERGVQSGYVVEGGGGGDGNEGGQADGEQRESSSNTTRNGCDLVQLYPAGKILQIYQKNRSLIKPEYELLWANKEIYYRVIIGPRMVTDHMPDVVMKAMSQIAANM